jgi:hypothetical protein
MGPAGGIGLRDLSEAHRERLREALIATELRRRYNLRAGPGLFGHAWRWADRACRELSPFDCPAKSWTKEPPPFLWDLAVILSDLKTWPETDEVLATRGSLVCG